MMTWTQNFLRTTAAWTMAGSLLVSAQADVSLQVDDSPLFVSPGGTLVFDLFLEITEGEQVAGIDYQWQAGLEVSGFLSLVGRDIGPSPISLLFFDNAEVLAGPGNTLDPVNAYDLGGLTEEAFVSTGRWLVASYSIYVSELLAPGTYQITTFSTPGAGWATPPPGSQSFAFDRQAQQFFTVVPEASSLLLGLVGVAATVFIRVHRSKNFT